MVWMIQKSNFFDVGLSVDPLDSPKFTPPPGLPMEAGPLAIPGHIVYHVFDVRISLSAATALREQSIKENECKSLKLRGHLHSRIVSSGTFCRCSFKQSDRIFTVGLFQLLSALDKITKTILLIFKNFSAIFS